jgi:hypothetical protein
MAVVCKVEKMKKFNTQDRHFHRIRLLCLIALMALVAACSSIRLSYNHGDTLLYWWMDAYVDLDSQQAGEVRQDIKELFHWHRKTQLNDYGQLLARAQRQLAGTPTSDDLMSLYGDIKGRSQALAIKALPDLADLARSMRPEQIVRMEKKFASNNDTYRKKFMRGDQDKRQKQRFQKSMEQFELWFGNFSREQEAALRRASDVRPLDNQLWLDERIRRQQRIVATVRKIQLEKMGKDAAMAEIKTLITELFDRLDHSEHKAFFDASTKGTVELVLTAVRIATPAQKAHAQKRMQGWIDDFKTLAADK